MKTHLISFVFIVLHSLSSAQTIVGIEQYLNTELSHEERIRYMHQIDSLDVLIKNDSDNSDLLTQRGYCYALLGLHVKAIWNYDQALMYNRENAKTYYLRGLSKNRYYVTQSGCFDMSEASSREINEAYFYLDKNCKVYAGY